MRGLNTKQTSFDILFSDTTRKEAIETRGTTIQMTQPPHEYQGYTGRLCP